MAKALPQSPLAPRNFADLPAIDGVRLATAATGVKYKGRDDLLLCVLDRGAAIAGVLEGFEGFAQEHALNDTVRRQTLLVLDDLLNNVASYAYAGEATSDDNTDTIDVHVELAPGRLIITISDGGVPFNPFIQETPDTNLDVDEREIGGLGIHLVMEMLDQVSYQRRVNHNVVTLMKRIEPQD